MVQVLSSISDENSFFSHNPPQNHNRFDQPRGASTSQICHLDYHNIQCTNVFLAFCSVARASNQVPDQSRRDLISVVQDIVQRCGEAFTQFS